MYLFSESLVCKHLLLLENLLCEADLHFNDGLLVDNPLLGSAVVDKELLLVYLDSLSALYIAHESTVEEGIEICLFHVVEGLLFLGTCFLVLIVSCPNRSYSYNLDRLRS